MTQPNRPSVDDFLYTGGGARPAKWGQTEPKGPKAPGAIEGGTILSMEMIEEYVYNSDPTAPKVQAVWTKSGDLKWQLKVIVQTNAREDEEDDGKRSIFVKGPMKKTIETFLRDNKLKRLEIGGELLVKFVRTDYQADGKPNVWAVKYTPPVAKAAEDFFETSAPQQLATLPQQYQPAPVAHHGTVETQPDWSAPAAVPAATPEPAAPRGNALSQMRSSLAVNALAAISDSEIPF